MIRSIHSMFAAFLFACVVLITFVYLTTSQVKDESAQNIVREIKDDVRATDILEYAPETICYNKRLYEMDVKNKTTYYVGVCD